MGIATLGAVVVIKGADSLVDKIRKSMPRRKSTSKTLYDMRRVASFDLDLQDEDSEFDDPLQFNDYEQHVCLTCFRMGLLLNTCLTVSVGAAVLPCPGAVTIASLVGIFLAAVAGAILWMRKVCHAR